MHHLWAEASAARNVPSRQLREFAQQRRDGLRIRRRGIRYGIEERGGGPFWSSVAAHADQHAGVHREIRPRIFIDGDPERAVLPQELLQQFHGECVPRLRFQAELLQEGRLIGALQSFLIPEHLHEFGPGDGKNIDDLRVGVMAPGKQDRRDGRPA